LYDTGTIKAAAAGRWLDILTAAGVGAELLDGKGHPCPRCGGTDRFSAFRDVAERGAVICRKCLDKGGGDGLATVAWIRGCSLPEAVRFVADHVGIQPGGRLDTSRTVAVQVSDQAPRPDPATLDCAYRDLLPQLELSQDHRKDLQRRGMSDADIDVGGYRSLPDDTRMVAAGLLKAGHKGIPGILSTRINAPAGLLIPVRDPTARIIALRIRPDAPGDGGKYRWLSSVTRRTPDAPSPGSPAHVPHGIGGPCSLVRITEGELKADVAYRLSEVPTVSFPGVGSWRAVLPILAALQAQTVRVAFDADAPDNKHVARSLRDCVDELRRDGYAVELERWPIDQGKGIDDLLAAGGKPEILTGDAATSTAQEIAVAAGVDVLAAPGGNPRVGVGGVSIEYTPSGRNGAATFTARHRGEIIAVEKLDTTKPKQRDAFIKTLCSGRPELNGKHIDAALLTIAAELASKPDPAAVDLDALPEIDVSRILRPERFITADVSGLSVPTMTMQDGRPVGRWLMYLRWANGRRERRLLSMSIELTAGRRFWIHPFPADPAANTPRRWSGKARVDWLAGDPAPAPADLFQRICERIAYFVDLPAEHAPGITATLALWVLLTYCYQTWDAVPYLYVGGPLGSGKSTVFEILKRLVFRPLASSNMTAAALFRTLHGQGGTLLLDEAEQLRNTRAPEVQELLSMLLAGYKRGGTATRLEAVGDTFRTLEFDVFGPKALACITGLPPALSSRAILITMFRAAPGSEKPRRRMDADPDKWRRLRDDLHAVALEYGSEWLDLAARSHVCPAAMAGRNYELWQPLLALANWLESRGAGGLHGLLQSHALQTIDGAKDEQTPDTDETLLRIIADAVRIGRWLTAQEILDKAQELDQASFKNWHPRTVQGRLKSYGIPKAVKSGSRRQYRDVTPDLLQRIQYSYDIDLGFPTIEADTESSP